MNTELWNAILAFDFDDPPTEYSFSTRLENENFWTKNFTAQAILEYKKFMYLAATSGLMVSPSEVVDVIWHQHLIFTQSYQDFCGLLGKQIQHIPSTHSREEAAKFSQAKERTEKLYGSVFGEPPSNIWNSPGMYESLGLAKARLKIRTGLLVGIMGIVILIPAFYFGLRPLYVHINNPYFLIGFVALALATLALLETYNRKKLRTIVKGFPPSSFVFHLQPPELIYLETGDLRAVINAVLNELLETKALSLSTSGIFESNRLQTTLSIEQLQAWDVIAQGKISYANLLYQLERKPIFATVAGAMNAFKKYFSKAKKFSGLFYLNFFVLSFLWLLGFTRFLTGLLRDKPTAQISFVLFVLTAACAFYLYRLPSLICTKTIPSFYKRSLLSEEGAQRDPQWSYFLFGEAAFAGSFAELVRSSRSTTGGGDGGSSSCGSSCGSSCSSCGGCGGGD